MINPQTYYTVQGWMRSDLGLKGNALAVYAIIYGFSQDGASEYAGSSRYLAEWLGCDKKTILRILADLTEKGCLVKKTIYQNGVTFCNYVAARPEISDSCGGGDEMTPPGTNCPQGGDNLSPGAGAKCPQGGDEMSPHNTSHNSSTYKSNNNTPQNGEETPPTPPPAPKITTAEINGFFETVWKLYPKKLGKADVSEKKRRELYQIGYDELKRAVERYKEGLEREPWRQPQYGSTFFNSGYVDYLDINYEAPAPQPARPRGYGAPPANLGPNGIPIDQSGSDLDAIF